MMRAVLGKVHPDEAASRCVEPRHQVGVPGLDLRLVQRGVVGRGAIETANGFVELRVCSAVIVVQPIR